MYAIWSWCFKLYFRIALSVVHYLNVTFSRLFTSVGEERADFLLSITRNFVVSIRRSFPFTVRVGKAALVYCGTLLAFYTNILPVPSRTAYHLKE